MQFDSLTSQAQIKIQRVLGSQTDSTVNGSSITISMPPSDPPPGPSPVSDSQPDSADMDDILQCLNEFN